MIRVRGGGIAESEGDPIRVITVSKHVLAELDALGDGSANSIYLEIRSSADPVGRRVALGGVTVTWSTSSLGTRGVTNLGVARSDLVLVEALPCPRRTRSGSSWW